VLVLDRAGAGPEVFVCGVIRDPAGKPSELSTPIRLIADAQQATSASWVDESHVLVLARRPGSAEQPWMVEIGGDALPTLPVQGTLITAGNSDTDVYVQTATGTVRTRLGSGWSDVPGVHWPSMPG
ncbi:MAG TPA: LpqB family beta-propeller domain-containing protein, partial [Kineosporiaceae bacterium]|nr:LpqB family beta-propeller domain-containing protein [Kineosporiaceae bacterium]